MAEKPEERAIPEPILIKRQMLESYSNASLARARYTTTNKKRYYKDWQTWIKDLFGWLEVKIDFDEKDFNCLKKLQNYMNSPNGIKMSYKDWSECWFALRLRMETLGITKIEMEEEDVYTLLKRP